MLRAALIGVGIALIGLIIPVVHVITGPLGPLAGGFIAGQSLDPPDEMRAMGVGALMGVFMGLLALPFGPRHLAHLRRADDRARNPRSGSRLRRPARLRRRDDLRPCARRRRRGGRGAHHELRRWRNTMRRKPSSPCHRPASALHQLPKFGRRLSCAIPASPAVSEKDLLQDFSRASPSTQVTKACAGQDLRAMDRLHGHSSHG